MPRDNFSKPVIRALRERVNNCCSNPDCRVATLGPKEEKNKSVLIGEAAHICAASPGGARYDPRMTKDERSSIDNGIWLCANCAGLIDKDVEKHTVELLKMWKKAAELQAGDQLGKPHTSERDVVDAVGLVTGVKQLKPNAIAKAISSVIRGSERYYSSLDPRFNVKGHCSSDALNFFIQPLEEDVSVSLTVSGDDAEVFANHYQRLVNHGEGFQIPTESVRFHDSPLLDHLVSDPGGKLTLGPVKKPASMSCEIFYQESKIVFEPFVGEAVFGRESISFDGVAIDKMIRISFSRINPVEQKLGKMNISIDLSRWENCNVDTLPYVDQLLDFVRSGLNDGEFLIRMRVDGYTLFSGKLKAKENQKEFFENAYGFIYYTSLCQKVVRRLGASVPFCDEACFSDRQILKMESILPLLNGEVVERPLGGEPVIATMSNENMEGLKEYILQKPKASKLVLNGGNEYLELFGKKLSYPSIRLF